jgi:protein SCO1/2
LKSRVTVRILQILVGTLLGVAAAVWWLGREASRPLEPQLAEDYFLTSPLPAPEFTLTSHLGNPTSSLDFPGKVLAVFFGYSFCPDVCPLTLTHLTEAFRLMGEEGDRVQVLLISVDPARDTPEQLQRYLSNFHPSFMGLTGSEASIREVADGFGAFFAANGEGENYTVDHTARTFIVVPGGEIPLTFPVTASPEEMARDLTRLLDQEHP